MSNPARASVQIAKDLMDPVAAKIRKKAEERQSFLAQQRKADLRWHMNDARGRRLTYALVEKCGLNASTLNERGEPSAVHEGRRGVAIEAAREILADQPELWLVMLREALELRGGPVLPQEDTEDITVLHKPMSRALFWSWVVCTAIPWAWLVCHLIHLALA